MNRACRLLAVVSLFFLASAFQAPPQNEALKWQVLSPPNSQFAIQMPGKPREEMHDATAKGGQATTQHLFVLDLPNVSYMAMYTSYTYNLGGSERSMDDFRDSFLKGMQAKLVDEKPTGLAGLHGRIIHAESTDGKMEAYLRLYVARRRLYQFLVMKPKGAPLSADDLKFFESLQFISVTPP